MLAIFSGTGKLNPVLTTSFGTATSTTPWSWDVGARTSSTTTAAVPRLPAPAWVAALPLVLLDVVLLPVALAGEDEAPAVGATLAT